MSAYKPKSEEQLDKEGLLPDAEYDFEVVETKDKPSQKTGNFMYTLKLHIFGEDGYTRIVWDYIALGSNFAERKLRHAADSAGIIDIYETGNMKPSDFQGRTGKVKLKQVPAKDGYPAKNVVDDYIKREISGVTYDAPKKAAVPTTNDLDDSIPF